MTLIHFQRLELAQFGLIQLEGEGGETGVKVYHARHIGKQCSKLFCAREASAPGIAAGQSTLYH